MNWEILDSEYAFKCPWINVRKDHVRMPSGVEIPDFYVSELPDWVNVIAITKDNRFVIEGSIATVFVKSAMSFVPVKLNEEKIRSQQHSENYWKKLDMPEESGLMWDLMLPMLVPLITHVTRSLR